ncbi:MAG: tRNA guanosine(34) transglycosylase Tgt [bacterium]|nr:tRNA guanosine(34) transglycosylase Tgt [bacterium]
MSKAKFTTLRQVGKYGREGYFDTRRGRVMTPTFMPDGTRGVVKTLTAEQVKATGVNVVLANTYHLHLQPGEETVASLGGLHEFGKWQGPILTDSGGFQVFSLGKHTKISEEGVTFKDPVTGDKHTITPESSMQIQLKLGSDMFVAFDHLIGMDDASAADTKDAFDRTHRWLERCVTEFKKLTKNMTAAERPLLFGVVQGGLDLNLREKSLEVVQSTDVDGIAIGGLSVGEPQADMFRVLEHLAPLYDDLRPRFLLGVGAPADLRFAYSRGIDMADCVMPTRNARHATVWARKPCTCESKPGKASLSSASRPIFAPDSLRSSLTVPSVRLAKGAQNSDETSLECKTCGSARYVDERLHLTNEKFAKDPDVIDPGCDCYTCANGYSKGFLRHQFKVGEPLAGSLASIHNLRYLTRICEDLR